MAPVFMEAAAKGGAKLYHTYVYIRGVSKIGYVYIAFSYLIQPFN